MASAPSPAPDYAEWFSEAELAELALPGLPANRRLVNRHIRNERWDVRMGENCEPLIRPRKGRGGGTEYHVSLLPSDARVELVSRGICAPKEDPTQESARALAWKHYDALTKTAKSEAEQRLGIVNEVELHEDAGLSRTSAIGQVSTKHGISKNTVWSWLRMVEGIARCDRLPALAPKKRGGGIKADIDHDLWKFFKSDYLRQAQPPLSSCYRRVAAKAQEMGIAIPSERTFKRKLEREVPASVILLAREGKAASKRGKPALRMSVEHMHALEYVNADGHKFDVWVHDGDPKQMYRPIMVAIQDIYSSKILAWRIDRSENALVTRLVFADLFKNFGIPVRCKVDNGMAFASKQLTGGTPTRYRWKVRKEDPTGVLVGLGIDVVWAEPAHGQSKPIERAFRDIASDVSRAPAMEGAYTGNSPLNRPENCGSRIVPIAEFEEHVARGIAAHNARAGRTGRHYAGRSFDDVFVESYKASPIRRATPEQLRMALLAADQKMVNKLTGEINLFGNRYYGPECQELKGQKVTVRFDPEYLFDPVHLYDLDGRFLCSIPLIEDARFDNMAEARRAAAMEKAHKRMVREALQAQELLAAEELAAMEADIAEFEMPEPGATRLVHHRGNVAALHEAVPAEHRKKQQQAEKRQSSILGAVGLTVIK